MAFKPEEHFRNLKGSQYLDVRWRVCWFRDEHPDGYIKTKLVEHDAVAGHAVFKARAGYFQRVHFEDGHDAYPPTTEVYATGYGSETRKDFADYLEKSETKAVGRALAMLGYGTQFAQELEEGERIVDSPVDQKTRQQATPAKPATTNEPTISPKEMAALDAELAALLECYPDAKAALDASMKTSGATKLSVKAKRDMVAKLKARVQADDLEPTPDERYAAALVQARKTLDRIKAQPGGGTTEDIAPLQTHLQECQMAHSIDGEMPVAEMKTGRALMDALQARVDAERGAPAEGLLVGSGGVR